MDRARVERLVRELLAELGEDPARQGLVLTPARVSDLLEKFSPRKPEPVALEPSAESAPPGEMTLVQSLGFFSLCEHHLLPFFGRVHVGCIERERAVDAATCARIVERFARRPQLQERLTEQIADALVEALRPDGVGVAAEGRHMCMMMRGVEKQNSEIQSSTLRGCFYDPAVRRAFFQHVMRAAPMRV